MNYRLILSQMSFPQKLEQKIMHDTTFFVPVKKEFIRSKFFVQKDALRKHT